MVIGDEFYDTFCMVIGDEFYDTFCMVIGVIMHAVDK